MIIGSFLFFLFLFAIIGLTALTKTRNSTTDYLLASQNVKPWLVALSAIATNNSGYMFIGMIGYTYMVGLSSIWLMIGWIVGDFIASLFIHKRLRIVTENVNAHSFGGILSHWHAGEDYKRLRFLIGIVTVFFLGAYAAAQLNAGGKALHVLFGWDRHYGAVIGAAIVLLYSYAGGIRASIWTDAAQSFVMIIAMGVMLWISIDSVGGIEAFGKRLQEVGPHYMAWFPSEIHRSFVDTASFILGWLFAGFGVVGQPHIMVRFMAMDNPNNLTRTRIYYYSWFILFYAATICVGLAARIFLPETAQFDPELALPTLASNLLPEILIGLVLAGIFAATMSTADSLILSCSASLTHDFIEKKKHSLLAAKIATASVVLLALGIALSGASSVFSLVLDAWGVLATAFAPLLAVYALGQKPTEGLAITMLTGGVGTLYIWKYFPLLPIYEIAPGIMAGLVIFFIGRILGYVRR
ncbi:MAG: sodium/proline symporter [Campylobacterales bacterium]|nr:sodium/proline symporter [Campylobacterales bacterium]